MPEKNTVVGMAGHDDLPGPGRDPVPYIIPERDQVRTDPGDPDATSKRYFLETESPELGDVVERIDDEDD